MARLEVDWAFLRSARGALKIARTLAALIAFTCFRGLGTYEAYTAVVGTEMVIPALFLLLYLLKLNTRMRFLYWPLADILNSAISALFFLVMSLFALLTETSKGTLTGGVSRNIVNEFQLLKCRDLNLLVHSHCGRTMQTTVLEEHSQQ